LRRSTKPIVIASRQSTLAKVQAQMVGNALRKLHPKLDVEYRWIESDADKLPGSLAQFGGKGLFATAIEAALLRGKADIAVHCLKDLPASDEAQTAGLTIAAIPKRADMRDCLVARGGITTLEGLHQGAVVGTSSPRRAAQVLRARPDLRVRLMRGNVDTRIAKVLDPQGEPAYDAALLAAAALRRLGRIDLAAQTLGVDQIMPAAAQGALAIQCRADDHVSLTRCLPLNHAETATAVHAERQLVAALRADCHSPVAVLAAPVPPEQTTAKRNADAHWFSLRVRVVSGDGTQALELAERVKTRELRRLVKRLAKQLRDGGADELLASAEQRLPWFEPMPVLPPKPAPARAAVG